MKNLYMKIVIALLLIVPRVEARDQMEKKPSPNLVLESVRRDTRISVRIRLENPSKSRMYIPYSGEHGGEWFASVLAVHLESYTSSGWQPAKAVSGYPLLGGEPLERCLAIEQGKTQSLLYQFDVNRYKLVHGQRLRLIVDAWTDETSLKTKPPTERLLSPEFKMP